MPARPKPRTRRLLIGRDKWTKQVMAHLVRCKGLGDETIVKRVTQSVDELGYRKVVIKTDGEPALIAVQETLVENPPAGPTCNMQQKKSPKGWQRREKPTGQS